jgi:hypothetical protein
MNQSSAAVLEQSHPPVAPQPWGWQGETKTSAPNAQELWKRYHQQQSGADADTENALVQKYIPLVTSVMSRLAMTLPEHVSGTCARTTKKFRLQKVSQISRQPSRGGISVRRPATDHRR